MTNEEKEVYAELLSFIAIYFVELSTSENTNLKSRVPFSSKIKNYEIQQTGLSKGDWMAGLFSQLGVAETSSTGYYVFVLDADEIRELFYAQPRPDLVSLDYLLDVFLDICGCLLYTSPSPRDKRQSRMPSSA